MMMCSQVHGSVEGELRGRERARGDEKAAASKRAGASKEVRMMWGNLSRR